MRITGIKTTPVAVPFRTDEVWAFGRRSGQASVLVELETDEGVVGIGEAATYPSTDIVLSVFKSLEPLVIGADPFRIEQMIRRIDVVGTWHHVGYTSPAMSAIEMACWDIVGKVSGQPLVNLFGGKVRDEVEYMYYVAKTEPQQVAEEGRRAAKAGFNLCYVKVGSNDPQNDLDRIAALREAAGPDMKIRVDANEAWSPGAAVQMIRKLEAYDLESAEQPVSGRNLDEMAYVRSRINIPLLANEAAWTREMQLEVIRRGAADVLEVDNQMDGGLANMRRSAGMCEAAGLPVIKHSLGELGIALAAATHAIAATPNFRSANQAYGALLTDDIVKDFGGGIENYTNGCLKVPDGPGLGVELDREKVKKYAKLYQEKAASFAFHDPEALKTSPSLPKF